jgi:opacity protein-like surface antigen
LSLLVILACPPTRGQQNFASISFGASLPQGDYAATGNLATSGYARAGGAIKFDAAYFPVSYFGIGGSFSFGSNYASRDSLLKDMTAHVEENASSIIDIPNDAEILYGTGFWNNINLFLGPHFSVRATQKLYFDFRALAGLSFLRPPDQELSILFDDTEIYSRISNTKLALGINAGAGLRYRLNSNIALKLGADYNQARSKFNYAFNLFQGVATNIPQVESNFFVRTIELSAGLAYSF